MKTTQLFIIAIFLFTSHALNAQVAINTDGSSADASAMLEVKSTEKGFLPPRLTESQRDAIASPATGLWVWCTDCGDNGEMQVYNGTAWTNIIGGEAAAAAEPVPNVTNPTTGKIWMDRNLGATRVAQSSTDADAYGDLYQWGRGSDGHESRTSGTTSTQSTSDNPGHGNFIIGSSDWRNPQNNNLWQGVTGTNNPCPTGYRLPTSAELDAERATWSSNNAAGAFTSPLKLPLAGFRYYYNGSIGDVSFYGYYLSSTVYGGYAYHLLFRSINATISYNYRANGYSVRCIKD
jgi:uncharacterized protein (TIGR02145 family)